MNPLETDFWGITNGLFITFVGLMAIGISSFRWKRKDFSLAYFGLFCLIYGIRWLAETATMRTLVGFPFTAPYFDRLLSYLVAIPLAAFLVDIFGPGLYKSMLWAFRTIIAYAVIAICIDLFRQKSIAVHPAILSCGGDPRPAPTFASADV